MSGKGPARIPAPRRAVNDATIASPWFGPPRLVSSDPKLQGRPWILTFVGIEKSFVELLFEGVAASDDGYVRDAFPQILAMRDFSEPPRPLLNGDGTAAYVRGQVEPTDVERPVVGELAPDDEHAAATTLAALIQLYVADAFPTPDSARPAWLRKLYLPMHQHFHVVACELDCKRPGMPRIDPKRVLEAGIVVRRFIPDPKAVRPRWEDWVPSPHGDGIWTEIADDDMITLHGAKGALDPSALPGEVFGDQQVPVYRRLGVDKDPTVSLHLATVKLTTFPASVPPAKKHTARWGLLPVSSSEKERELLDPADDAQAIAAAFAAAADAHLSERIINHAQPICDRVRAAVLPILQGLRAALPPRPAPLAVALAYIGILLLSGGAPDVDKVCDDVAFDALLNHAQNTLTIPVAQDRWNAAVFSTATTPRAQSFQYPPTPPYPLHWAYQKAFPDQNARDALATVGLDRVWTAMDAALPGGTTLGNTFEPRLLLAALLWVRGYRIEILRLFYDKAFRAFTTDVPEDKAEFDLRGTRDPSTNKLVVTRPRTTVGALGREIDAWVSVNTNDAREKEPVPWKQVTVPQNWNDVHAIGSALEDALDDVDRQGAGAGGAYAEYMDTATTKLYYAVENGIGLPLAAQGIDLHAQPERGLLSFPGPAPTVASLSDFKDAIAKRYTDDAQQRPEASRDAGKAYRKVIRCRYDASNLYAVWCYARVAGRDPCEQPQLVWSRRTEVFQLAEPMDLLGLKPVAFQLPDLPKLMRDIPRMRKAKALPFATVTTPQDSGVKTGKEPADTARAWGIAWICSFGIPVFTICAWILFQIIFSILLVIPGFAWMLLLKFCIPVPKRS